MVPLASSGIRAPDCSVEGVAAAAIWVSVGGVDAPDWTGAVALAAIAVDAGVDAGSLAPTMVGDFGQDRPARGRSLLYRRELCRGALRCRYVSERRHNIFAGHAGWDGGASVRRTCRCRLRLRGCGQLARLGRLSGVALSPRRATPPMEASVPATPAGRPRCPASRALRDRGSTMVTGAMAVPGAAAGAHWPGSRTGCVATTREALLRRDLTGG